jgi:transglutaminase-like putative cysteine protease
MRICTLILLVSPFLFNIAGSKAIADGEIPTPSVDRIDYTHPEKYTDISPAFGDVAAIRKIGETLRSSTQKRSIAAILKWMGKNLRYDANVPDGVRNFDAIVTSKVYGGCAEHSVVFAALAKACGIPTVTVKTMDADWIRRFRTTGETDNWSGHVFLEVFFDGTWHLLNATQMELTDNYDHSARIFPGNR